MSRDEICHLTISHDRGPDTTADEDFRTVSADQLHDAKSWPKDHLFLGPILLLVGGFLMYVSREPRHRRCPSWRARRRGGAKRVP